jgi:hypothetical protein
LGSGDAEVEGVGVDVAVGVDAVEGVDVGVGVMDGDAVGEGSCFFKEVPLFQTNFFPDLTHVYFLP